MRRMTLWLMSVRGRITVAVTILFTVALALGGWFLLDRAEAAWIDDLESQDLAELEALAESLQAFDIVAGGAPVLGDIPLPVGVDGTVFQLVDQGGMLVAATPSAVFGTYGVIEGTVPMGDVSVEFIAPGFGVTSGPDLVTGFDVIGVTGDVTTVSLPVDLTQGTLTLSASSSLAPVQAGVTALRSILMVIVPLLAAGVGTATWLVTGRSFRPVADITSQVERITDERLEERVPVPESRDEVAHLAQTMNTMLDRLSASRRRQREFVSDASHELRNPVATSKVKLETALAHPTVTDWEDTARIVLEEQNRLGSLVDDLLLLARIDEGQPSRRDTIDLDDIVFAEAARPSRHAVDVTHVGAARVKGDAKQLTRLVRNLIDNATRHTETTVTVSLVNTGDESVVTVDDDGPGIPKQDRTPIFERFVRLEDARTRDQGGAGLGLALVHAVATAHNGTVNVSQSPLGGARFEVHLPNPSSQTARADQGDPDH